MICERFLGTSGFLLVFFGAGLMGNVASLLFMDPTTPSLGSSGAVFGLIGALLADEINRGRRVRELWHFPFGRQLLVVTALNLAIGLSLNQFINNYAHVGGLLSGFVISLLFVSTNRRPDDATDPWLRAGVLVLFALLTIWACVPAFRPDASNALAYTLASKGQKIDRATRLAEEARRFEPENVMIEGTLAVCYIRAGRAREAVPLLEDTVRRHQAEWLRAIDLLWLALAKEKAGDLVGARQNYGDAVKSGNALEPAERGAFEIVKRAVKTETQRSK
ncbi:MAG: rhomboid family intramembrane serine protease [Planctomycetes bacterium]|nr:rhomboid family intramembrane serine protease [Planctomycetota bacterium]